MLLGLQPPGMLPVRAVRMDWVVLAYVVAIATASGLLFGIAPALWSGNRAPADVLKEGGRSGSAGRRMRRWGHALVMGEVAVALLLTVGAGLLVRSFWELLQVDPGFEPRGVLAVPLDPAGARYDTDDKVYAFYDELLVRARALPGVDEAAATSDVPLSEIGWGWWSSQFAVAGRGPDEYGDQVLHRQVTPGYFRVMHGRIVRGRDFTPQDAQNAPNVVLINETLARAHFRGQDPIGQRVAFSKAPDATSTWWTIVGIVGDDHQAALDADPQIEFITPLAQETSGPSRSKMILVIRTEGDPAALAPAVRQIVADLDPNIPIASIQSMEDVRTASLVQQRFLMTLLLVFAGVGLVLALVGVYGVMSQFATGRKREMGIRMALGAPATQVRRQVMDHGLRLVAVGLGLGLAGAFLATRTMTAFLYQVVPGDPVTFVAVPLLLLIAAFTATWLPVRRASRANLVATLREE